VLVDRQLVAHLPTRPGTVLDVGGGAGHQAIRLARRGHVVTLIDASPEMIAAAGAARSELPSTERDRVRCVLGDASDVATIVRGERFDAVLCHGVLLYLDDSEPLLRALAPLVRPGGILSILTKNANATAMRPALEGHFEEALELLRADRSLGNLGVVTRGDSVSYLARICGELDVPVEQWYGIRIFTDHFGDAPPDERFAAILELEAYAATLDPYRQLARLVHMVGRRVAS
jgi:SAM-dependent methyltransferase